MVVGLERVSQPSLVVGHETARYLLFAVRLGHLLTCSPQRRRRLDSLRF
jgi:hypothetical protein